jgi:hypothetical protein
VDVPDIDVDLRLAEATSGLRLEGSIRPRIALEDAVLLTGGRVENLGDLEAGQEVAIREPFHGGTMITGGLAEHIMGTTDYWDDPLLYRRYHFLGAVFDPYYGPYYASASPSASLESGVYLIGWSDESIPLSTEVVDWPYSAVGTALYIYALPVTEEADLMSVIPPELVEREMVDVVGRVQELPDGIHMESVSQVTFRFTPWGTEVPEVEEIVLDMQPGYEYAYSPSVAIWDWEREVWREVDVAWGPHSIPNAGRYVSSSGVVLLHFEAASRITIERLELTIKGK